MERLQRDESFGPVAIQFLEAATIPARILNCQREADQWISRSSDQFTLSILLANR